MDRAAFRAEWQTIMEQETAGMTQTEINTELGFSSIAAFIDSMVDASFSNRSYTYSFASDETTLFLENALPANQGMNELGGKTYYFYYEQRQFVFTASDYTFDNYDGTEIKGSYAYDSSQHKVWLVPKTIDGETRSAYYDSKTVGNSHRYPDDNTARASETNYAFDRLLSGYQYYDSVFNSIGGSPTSGTVPTGTYTLNWGLIDKNYYTGGGSPFDDRVAINGSDWALATGSDATDSYNWCMDGNVSFVEDGSFSDSFANCLNFSKDGISAPAGLKTASKNYSGNMPLAGIFDGGDYTVLFYVNAYGD